MKLRSISIGVVIGLFLGLLHVINVTERDMAEINLEIEEIHESITSTSIAVQFSIDADKVLEEWTEENDEEEWKPQSPYSCIPLNDDYQVYMEERCNAYNIDFFLAVALMESESNFREECEGDSKLGGSYGLFQINNVWWESMSEKGLDVFNNIDNIEIGLMILSSYLDKYQDEAIAIQMYKCGESRGREFLASGIVLEQAKRVVERAKEIEEEATQSED